jgi:hypothetical protein
MYMWYKYQARELSLHVHVLEVPSQRGEPSCTCMYMKAHFSGLILLSLVHEGSLLWLGISITCTWRLSITCTWRLTSLTWYLYHMYMKALCHMYMNAHFSGLVPLSHVHEGSLLWPGTSIHVIEVHIQRSESSCTCGREPSCTCDRGTKSEKWAFMYMW